MPELQRYREAATRCIELAALTNGPNTRAELLLLAGKWNQLATDGDRFLKWLVGAPVTVCGEVIQFMYVGGPDPLNLTPNTEGQVWGKGLAKLNFVFSNRFSAYIEGNVRGTKGTSGAAPANAVIESAGNGAVDAFGYGGQIGVRLVY